MRSCGSVGKGFCCNAAEQRGPELLKLRTQNLVQCCAAGIGGTIFLAAAPYSIGPPGSSTDRIRLRQKATPIAGALSRLSRGRIIAIDCWR